MAYPTFILLLTALLCLLIFPLNSNAAEPSQLLPHVPSFINRHDLGHLNTSMEKHIWYRKHDRKNIHRAIHASLNLTLHQPTLVLNHSSHTTESCTDTELSIHFSTDEVFRHAKEAWNTPMAWPSSHLRAIVRSSTWGHHHSFFKTVKIMCDDEKRPIRASGAFVDLEDIASHARLQCGFPG